jgi:PAS domain S-box-containing protein
MEKQTDQQQDIQIHTPAEQQFHLLSTALEAAANAIAITDTYGRVLWVNRAFTRTTGYTQEEIKGQHTRALKSGMHTAEFYHDLWRTIASGQVWQGELVNRRKDGSLYHEEMTITPVRNADGVITHYIAIKQDITERKHAEQELQKAKDEAEAANRAKSTFLANMSHELRTPLNAIIGYSEMLEEEAHELQYDDLVPDLQKIQSAGKHLLSLINDILDFSKIEAGRMQLYLEQFNLDAMITDVVNTIQPLIEKNGNTIRTIIPDGAGVMYADLTKVRQILFNLLSNAAKFTEHGHITLEVRHEPRRHPSRPVPPPADASVIFRVADTGIGLQPQQIKNLFRPFSQADTSTTRKYGGTGLGLVISNHFCQMMGGAITVESEFGHGSTFTVRLPLEVQPSSGHLVADTASEHTASSEQHQPVRTPRPKAHTQPPPSGELPRLLVVDDDETARDLMVRALSNEGFHIETAANGIDGLRMVKEFAPDIIILDVMMQEMDGWAVLSALKEDRETIHIPVIMISFLDSREIGFALGAADYLTKPIDRKRLVNILHRYRSHHPEGYQGLVMVVEDDAPTRHLLRRTLEKENWNVLEAEHGRAALELLIRRSVTNIHPTSTSATSSYGLPDMILLDLMMPEMDGFQVIRALHSNPMWWSIPVIVITARELSLEEHAYLDTCVAETLQKASFNREELLREVRSLVHIYGKQQG